MARVLGPVIGAVVISAGCAQLAGIDETNDRGRGGNAATVTRVSIGKTVEKAPLDLDGLEATYFVANAGNATGFDRVLAADEGQGRWSADLPQPAAIELTVPDEPTPTARLVALPSRELALLYSVLEHPNREPAPEGATLGLMVMLDAPTTGAERFQIYTVGSWTVRDIAAAELPVAPVGGFVLSYPFSTSGSLSGRPLDRLTAQDAYLVLRYAGAVLNGFAEAPAFEQTGNDSVSVTMAAVAADQVLDVKFDPTQLPTRYASVRPAVSSLAMSWGLTAAPGYLFAQNTGPSLHGGGLLATDVGVNVSYGNPFAGRGWNTTFTLATSESRVFTPPGTMTPVTLYAGMNQFIEPSPGYALTLPAGLPELISLDGKPLSTDGELIAKPTRFVEVTFIADRPNPTLFNLQVYDLLPNAAATALDYHLVLAAASNEATFQLPPEIFQAGHSYTLRALCTMGGYPNLDSGDLATRTLPLSQSYLDSAVITVMP